MAETSDPGTPSPGYHRQMRAPCFLLLLTGCVFDALPRDPVIVDSPVRFGFPLPERELFYQTTGFDHDPEVQDPGLASSICTNYDGRAFPWCYDGHDGTDYLLKGDFETMDAGSTAVVAAADGEVVSVEDGHYDRCHVGSDLVVTCDGHDIIANHVILEHYDGTQTRYWHLAEGSVSVEVGDEVACGTPLGRVGSSGNSSFPHLHFEVVDKEGESLDPYRGPESQDESWWEDQGPAEGLPGAGCTAQ